MNKVFKFIRELHLFPEVEAWEDPDDLIEDDFMYAEFYLLKKLSSEKLIDLERIKNSTTIEEYKNNINEQFDNLKDLNSDCKEFFWERLYDEREAVINFINSLDLNEFDTNLGGDLWMSDDYLSQFINYKNTHRILSIFNTFYDDKLDKSSTIDVIYDEFQYGNIIGYKARLDILNCHNYNFKKDKYPLKFKDKYDLILLNINYGLIDSFDKTGLIKMNEDIGGVFDGDSVVHNIEFINNNLTPNGIAIIKTPFTFISKLDDDLIDKNIIDKIIYLPKHREPFAYEDTYVKNVYIIVNNNKDNNEIEFIDKETNERCIVKNELIKKHKGCTNMHIYNKNNPMLEKLYRIKEDNEKQFEIISKESEIISKQIDELDFE